MKPKSPTTSSNASPRCTFTTPSGRRCRSVCSSPESPFCLRHKPKEDPGAELVRDIKEFRSVGDVTVFLSRLISAVSKNQIPTSRASVLSYVAVSLMHSLRSLQKEHELDESVDKFEVLPWTWRMPRRGSPGFEDIDDARAFYAQQFADRMRKKVEEAMAERGLTSHYYPYRFDKRPKYPWDDDEPSSEDLAEQHSDPQATS